MATTNGFSPHVEQLIELALSEDLCGGDVTTDVLFDGDEQSAGRLVAKAPLVLAGGPVFAYVFDRVSRLPGSPAEGARARFTVEEGREVSPGTVVAELEGATVTLLRAERLGLNLLQRLSGIATLTRRYQSLLGADGPRIVDTRKTTPGLRELERYAVRVGGGRNHRFNLGAGVLIKDNHIAAVGGVAEAVRRARACAPHTLRVEVEVSDLDQLDAALAAGAEVVLLDNMDLDTTRAAIERVNGQALIELSGQITEERLPALADLAVDFISSGALTHSARAADISMLFNTP